MQIEGKRRPIWPRVLGYFLAAMLLLTLVSRAADALLLPVVECARPLPGALSHIVTLRGVVEAEEQQPVAAEAGLTIARVCVRAGQAVEAGDVLAEYDREALQRILEEKQAALQALALQAQLETAEPGTEPSSDGTVQPQSTSLDMQRQIAQQQLQDLETRAAQAEVERLTQLLYRGAALTAPVSGTISEVLVDVGDVATAGAAFRLAPASSALIARCEAASDQAEHLSIGMEARFQLSGDPAQPHAHIGRLRGRLRPAQWQRRPRPVRFHNGHADDRDLRDVRAAGRHRLSRGSDGRVPHTHGAERPRRGGVCGICRRDCPGNRRPIRGHRRCAACAGSGDRLEQ